MATPDEATKHSIDASDQGTTFENTNSDDDTRLSSAARAHTSSFVDHAKPPDVKILPPAKYKLWLLVFVLVYLALLVSISADLLGFLRFNGWLSEHAALFLNFCIIVFVIVYGASDLVITTLTFQTKSGKVYGIGAWMKQPRATWMYQNESLLFEILARVIHILEDGFSMFDAPPSPMRIIQQMTATQFDCDDGKCTRILKIEHRIKPDKLVEYKQWATRVRLAVESSNGFVKVETSEIISALDTEEGGGGNTMHSEEKDDDGNDDDDYDQPLYHVVYCTFSNIDYLNEWMASPRRAVLMKALQPMLATPDVVKVQARRRLPDSFTDLATRQGQAVPKILPKKWKVWWITVLALFLTVMWSNSFMPYYYEKWGMADVDWRVKRLVNTFVVTFLNSYIMTPLLLFVFHHWLQNSAGKNVRQPWKALDEGFQSRWPMLFLTVVFYGGCLIAAIVKQ
jgi:antibiotic biosynthesis monooxygenase (ABM) superfamily enzyme